MNLQNVSRDDWIVGGLALLLAIDLLLLPWFSFSAGVGPYSVSVDSTATGAPDGLFGILGVLAAVAVIADLALERLSPQTQIPAIAGSRGMTRFALAVAAAVFVALKFVFQIHFSLFAFGFYLAVVLAAGLVFAAMQARDGRPVLAKFAPSSHENEPPSAGPSAGPPGQ